MANKRKLFPIDKIMECRDQKKTMKFIAEKGLKVTQDALVQWKARNVIVKEIWTLKHPVESYEERAEWYL